MLLLYIVLQSVDLERQKKGVCARRSSSSSTTTDRVGDFFFLRYRAVFAETFPRWHIIIIICIMVRQMLAVAARRSWFTHSRVPVRYNMVRTRSRKSCVRGKTREKTGTELCTRVRRVFANECVVSDAAALPFAKYHFGDRVVSSGQLLFTSTRAYIASTHILDSRIA